MSEPGSSPVIPHLTGKEPEVTSSDPEAPWSTKQAWLSFLQPQHQPFLKESPGAGDCGRKQAMPGALLSWAAV